MKKLVLFDIDGTLLSTDGAAGRAFATALVDIFGTAGPIEEVSFAGKTDPQIAHELLAGAGLSRLEVDGGLPALWDRYTQYLETELAAVVVHVFPGVEACLAALEACPDEVAVGLLTGNIEGGAQRKLDASGIGYGRFAVGGFGSDHEHRNELPAIVQGRVEASTGRRYEGDALVVIGDTPADIACGAHVGARTIAVATGTYAAAQLQACEPYFLFDTLADTDRVLSAIIS